MSDTFRKSTSDSPADSSPEASPGMSTTLRARSSPGGFENLNSANTLWAMNYDLWTKVGTAAPAGRIIAAIASEPNRHAATAERERYE